MHVLGTLQARLVGPPGKMDLPAPGKRDLPAVGKRDLPGPGKRDLPAPGKRDLSDSFLFPFPSPSFPFFSCESFSFLPAVLALPSSPFLPSCRPSSTPSFPPSFPFLPYPSILFVVLLFGAALVSAFQVYGFMPCLGVVPVRFPVWYNLVV